MKTIACLIPLSWTNVPRQFFFSWCNILLSARDKFHILMITSRTASVRRMQEAMVGQIENANNIDYIFFVDADQTYPVDIFDKMTAHIDSGKDTIFGLVPRHSGGGYISFNFREEEGKPLYMTQADLKPDTGLVKVDCTGMGGLMVNPEIFSKIDKPYFAGLPMNYGPDVAFCYKLKKAGVEQWVDTSIKCGHIIPHVLYPPEQSTPK